MAKFFAKPKKVTEPKGNTNKLMISIRTSNNRAGTHKSRNHASKGQFQEMVEFKAFRNVVMDEKYLL